MGLGDSSGRSTKEKWSVRRGSGGRVAAAVRIAFCVVLAMAGTAIVTAARPGGSKMLTVERIYSAPSLSGYLTEGSNGAPTASASRISNVTRRRVELWTMDAATGDRKVLVNADLSQVRDAAAKGRSDSVHGPGPRRSGKLLWSPSGDALLFIGGSSLVLLDLKTMAPKTLVSGAVAMLRERSEIFARRQMGQLRARFESVGRECGDRRSKAAHHRRQRRNSQGQARLALPGRARNSTTAYWWSPDSSKIAYYQMDERPVTRYPIMDMSSPLGAMEYTRFPQAGEANPIVRVGVVPVAGGETRWMDTGADTDVYLPRVVWLRDSRRVAIERLNRAQNRLDLLLCDAATGASETILTETDKYWINIADDLYFFSDDKRFLWSSERTGFRHYYLYDLAGQAARSAHRRRLGNYRQRRLRPGLGQPSGGGRSARLHLFPLE